MDDSSIDPQRRKKATPSECKICGAPAIYSYCGVISCRPCNVFFRRYAVQNKKVVKCNFDGHCEINVNTRHVCSCCRLVKCFSSGMKIEMIRPSRVKRSTSTVQTKSTTLIQSNAPEQLPALNLLRSDRSTLTTEQWNLLSNLCHCYDEYSGINTAQQFMHQQNLLPLKLRFKSTTIMNIIKTIAGRAQSLYNGSQDFLSLSADDRSVLLCTTMKHTGNFLSNTVYQKVRLLNHPAFHTAVSVIANPSAISVTRRLGRLLDFDLVFQKLVLGILAFSTINYTIYSNIPATNLSDPQKVLHIQNTYIDLTWRYLLYKYDEKQAVICFSNLIRCLFTANEAIVIASEIKWFTGMIDDLIQQTQQTLIIND